MKVIELIRLLVMKDPNAEVTNDGWYGVTSVTDHQSVFGDRVILVFEDDD